MKPIEVNAFDIQGEHIAASKIAFGAACAYAAAGTIQATIDIAVSQNLIGIAVDDNVEKDEDGFYSQYDVVPLITAGRCRVWVTPNHTTAEDIKAGDYLEIADIGGTNTLPVGVFQEMDGEGGSGAGTLRQDESVARALEDCDLVNIVVVAADLAVGGTTVTLSSANMTTLDLSDGDYILLEDVSHNCMINRVKSTTATVITLQMASTVALANGTDHVHKLGQCEVMLI